MPSWLFPLPIFPEGSLASSVITTVWVGVFVIAFFNLRFGWVLSGLVVPGYLVPLLIARPLSFVVILVEASVTYFLVYLFSERLSGGGTWSSLFGRDRFVGLILTSIVVRLTFDGWLLPIVAAHLEERLQFAINWTGDLHSFGLIVISLLANQLWKPGFVRGMSQALVTIGITFLIVRYGLMELTNFRISAVAYLYEDIASSILASPKAYIILVITAFLASHMNLRYGWDFNGVLIPALIALQWYQPLKVLTSFAEAFAIYGLAILVLRLPVFANMTIEGARKVLLFFNISFAYRLLIGHVLFWTGADVQVTDYYGFGYLLSTLMAIKMLDKDILARLTGATLQISVLGAALGSAIGFALTAIPTPAPVPAGPATGDLANLVERTTGAEEAVGDAVLAGYRSWLEAEPGATSPAEFDAFRRGVKRLQDADEDPSALSEAAILLDAAGYRVAREKGGTLVLTDARENGARGTFLYDLDAPGDLVVSVPDPVAVAGLGLAALEVARATGAAALAFSGTSNGPGVSGEPGPGQEYATLFQAFHEAQEGGVLRVVEGEAPSLRVPRRLPPGLDAGALERMLGALDTGFGRDGSPTLLERATPAGFATLRLDAAAIRRIVAAGAGFTPVATTGTATVASRLLELARESDAPEPVDTAELLYFDREVLTPLLRDVVPRWEEGAREALGALVAAASPFGYALELHRDPATGREHLVLSPADGGGGVYAFRLAPEAEPFMIQVPRAGSEVNALEYGVALFERLDAFSLLLSGAPSRSDRGDGAETDLLDPRREASVFDLVSQSVLRERGRTEFMVIQPRGFAADPEDPPAFDAIVAFDVVRPEDDASSLGERLVEAVAAGGAKVGVVRGTPETAGFEFGAVRQAQYLAATEETEFAVVWLSAATRAVYADRTEAGAEGALFNALGIPTVKETPADFLARYATEPSQGMPPGLIASIEAYQERRDSVALRRAQVAFATTFTRLEDPVSRQSFLALLDTRGTVQALANLAPIEIGTRRELPPGVLDRAVVDAFVQDRAAWLWVGAVP